jgi:hypothetical protein
MRQLRDQEVVTAAPGLYLSEEPPILYYRVSVGIFAICLPSRRVASHAS